MSAAEDANEDPARLARRLLRTVESASLATIERDGGGPYASLVLVAADEDGSPILLLSDLAEHSRNLAADDRASLMIDGTAGLEDRLTGPRLTLLGRAIASDAPRHRAGFLARHPGAAQYADFGDFRFYRVAVERAHLVAGFGRVHAISADDLLCPESAG